MDLSFVWFGREREVLLEDHNNKVLVGLTDVGYLNGVRVSVIFQSEIHFHLFP